MRLSRTLALCLALAVPALPAAAQPQINPDWVRKPTGEEVADAYPSIANDVGVEGQAVIDCGVSRDGLLQACRTSYESPKGFGFGVAGLSLAPRFRMSPPQVNGRAVDGMVRIPILFRLPQEDAPAPLPKATSAAALAPARIAAKALQGGLPASRCEEEANKLDYLDQPGVSAADRGAAAAALRGACASLRPEVEEATAQVLASLFTADELRQYVAFVQSPGGKVLIGNADLAALNEVLQRNILGDFLADARHEFCSQVSCETRALAARDVEIASPSWVERPSVEDLAGATPPLVTAFAIPGAARLTCKVAAQGLLDGCTVAEEAPAGLGLGEAARSLAKLYRLEPESARRSLGRTTALIVDFPAAELPAAQPLPTGRSPRAVALARSVLGDQAAVTAGEQQLAEGLNGLEGPPPGGDPKVAQAARLAIAHAATRVVPHILDSMARNMASVFTEDELAQAAAFIGSPAGKAWQSKDADLAAANQALSDTFSKRFDELAHATYCKSHDCVLVHWDTQRSPNPPQPASAVKPEASTRKP